jgi:hypothetical protein
MVDRPEIALHQFVNRWTRRPGIGQRSAGADTLVGGGVYVDTGPIRLEHGECSASHRQLIHPMEGLGETHDPVFAQTCRELFGATMQPSHVADPAPVPPDALPRQACPVAVDSGRLLKPGRQQQREVAGTAADIEQAAGALKPQLPGESLSHCRRILDAAYRVMAGTPYIERWMPLQAGPITQPVSLPKVVMNDTDFGRIHVACDHFLFRRRR